jgi:hypothetical protein
LQLRRQALSFLLQDRLHFLKTLMQLGLFSVLKAGTATSAQRNLQVDFAVAVLPSCLMQSFMHCMTLAAFEGVPKFETDKVKMDNIAIKSKRWLINASLSYK